MTRTTTSLANPITTRRREQRDAPLGEALRYWAATTPSAPACTFLTYPENETVAVTCTYAELDDRVRRTAAWLQSMTEPRDRVALLLPNTVEFAIGFFACLYAGRIGVPLHAPQERRSSQRLEAVLADTGCAASLVMPGSTEAAEAAGNTGDVLEISEEGMEALNWVPVDIDVDATAYLQYTSGSTRRPAGVMVSNRNLGVSCGQMRRASEAGENGTIVSWLPFFHDMGLVAALCMPIQAGGHTVYLDPLAFVQRPLRWLQAMSDYRCEFTILPNFGLDLAVRKVRKEARNGLDLTSVRMLANGAEPIRASTIEAFNAAYEPHGFSPAAHLSGYGLAEATLMVASSPVDEPLSIVPIQRSDLVIGRVVVGDEDSKETIRLVGSGLSLEQDVTIVDPDTFEELPHDRVGEIWVRGLNVCAGYDGSPEESARTFRAKLARRLAGADESRADEPGWLRTGDLGFLHDDQLYITGRLKDLIIIGGKNHYPSDIEETVAAMVSEAKLGGIVACGVDIHAGERLVVVIELDLKRAGGMDVAATVRAIRSAVAAAHEIETYDVVFTGLGTIPRTTSGKPQHHVVGDLYMAGRFTGTR